MKGISIIICCYNSAERIVPTITSLKKQKLSEKFRAEVILVDNNCTDDTVAKSIETWGQSNLSLRIISESRAGLIYAREAGINAAIYDYLVFCDDDNWLVDTYVETVFNLFESYTNVGAIGGQSEAAFESGIEVPEWFYKEKNAFAVGMQGERTGIITDRLYLWGAGLAVRKEIVKKCFDPAYPFLLTGRKADKVTAGDDTEICNRIVMMGYDLYYDERLVYKHYIPAARLTEEYLFQMKKGFERSYGVLTLYNEFINSVVLNKVSKLSMLIVIIFQRPINKKKILRALFWLYGIALYANDDMRMIRGFYKNYVSNARTA